MAKTYLDYDGLLYFWEKLKSYFATSEDVATINTKIDDIVSEGGEPNVIETVQKNGTALTVTDKTVNVTVPTTVSELTNDSGYITSADAGDTNVIETVKVNGTALTVSSKAVNVTVPTKVSALTNDSDYQTADEVSSAISNAIADITGISYSIVSSLPSTGEAGVIYLVPLDDTETNNIYEEYIYVSSKFEKIGTTDVDLSDYVKTSDLTGITNSEIDTIVAS